MTTSAFRIRRGVALPAVLVILSIASWTIVARRAPAARPSLSHAMTLDEARPILTALDRYAEPRLGAVDRLTGEQWGAWAKAPDAEIRARVAAGDEDSVVNLMLYGTTFTERPRAIPEALGTNSATAIEGLMDGRLTDLARAVQQVDVSDERVRFVRGVIERHGIVPGPSAELVNRQYLETLRSRVLGDNQHYLDRLSAAAVSRDEAARRAAFATVYHDRGLSSDASLRVNFALERALVAMRDDGHVSSRPVQKVGVIGPGLDFIDKAQGHDFYPVQTLQPFALADSLRRLNLADRTIVTAFDINDRVLAHIERVRQRAAAGQAYPLSLVLERSDIAPLLKQYWQDVGQGVPTPLITPHVPAALAATVRARTVSVPSSVVLDVMPARLDIVVERLPNAELDLVVATNVLVYYEPLDQALAVRNICTMLRDGGILLTNQPIPAPEVAGFQSVAVIAVPFDDERIDSHGRRRGDTVYVYRKSHART